MAAEDEVVTRHMLEATLQKWGYEVVVAEDGARAWETLQADAALYRAKSGGRNRVELAAAEEVHTHPLAAEPESRRAQPG